MLRTLVVDVSGLVEGGGHLERMFAPESWPELRGMLSRVRECFTGVNLGRVQGMQRLYGWWFPARTVPESERKKATRVDGLGAGTGGVVTRLRSL